MASRPTGNAGKNFYIGLDYNPTFNGVKNLKIIEEAEGARGLWGLLRKVNLIHKDWRMDLQGTTSP
ncbi:hypothetical protein AOV_04870 [Anaplasma ovis str. Haibei]|uniref:P44/Msp2 family outer membrane protein n=1 Tax=Anaplasma ovis str. Haibei TaxID=1248439 RepID=A0A2Z2L8T4_9RICK|nr:hypothetical protein [Anaplasma ovis]ASI48069.1 hypothetical protein AOV_04870 [Anaplasma ovis str. Haibei]